MSSGAGQGWLLQTVPIHRLEHRIAQVDNLAACAVHGQTEGIGIGDQIVLHLAGRVDVDLHLEEVELIPPAHVAGDAPDTAGRIEHHRIGRARRRRIGVREAVQGDRPGGRRPDANRRLARVPGNTQITCVGVQIVEYARNLQTGGIDRQTLAVQRRNSNLALQDLWHQCQITGTDPQRRQCRQMRELEPAHPPADRRDPESLSGTNHR